MPVEIKELVIRAVIASERGNGEINPEQRQALEADEKQILVNECVKQVLSIIKRSKER